LQSRNDTILKWKEVRKMAVDDNGVLNTINKPESLRQEVYERLKDAIISNKLYPGQKLDETRLGKMLGVSRTPVREALNRLTHEGFVSAMHNRGMYVTTVTPQNLLEILDIREVLEGLAARLFTKNASAKEIEAAASFISGFSIDDVDSKLEEYSLANVAFHNALVNGSQNDKLINSLETLYDHFAMAKKLSLISVTRRAKRSLKEHLELIDAIRERDSQRAETLMRAHIHSLREDVVKNM
jgi:DNA-binding GntR family transcriptional regulator